jgi:putative transposase
MYPNLWKGFGVLEAELNRKLADERERSHGQLTNEMLSRSDTIILEDLSYRGWQQVFGKSVARKAPGMFVSTLKRKAESAGALIIEIPTKALKLSQYCHVRNGFVKKPLSQRYHEFPDGTRVDRDLYSAWLGAWAIVTIDQETGLSKYALDANQLRTSWASMGPYLLGKYDSNHNGYNQNLLKHVASSDGSVCSFRTSPGREQFVKDEECFTLHSGEDC